MGALVSLGAIFWLLASMLIGPTTALIVPGVIQLGVGLFLIAAKWIVSNQRQPIIILAAIVCLIVNTIIGCWFGLGSLANGNASKNQNIVLTAKDPDSPIVVTIEDSRGLLQHKPVWSCTIYADGKRPTQYTGWPIHLIGKNSNPVKLIWHNDDPDWIEIKLDNGFKLKLSWDEKAAFDARLISNLHYFLDPQFELIR